MRKGNKDHKVETANKELLQHIEEILEKRGRKVLETLRQTILEEKIECKEAREALQYFVTQYWHDLARPTLLSLCCEAVGGDPEATEPFAVALSLISGALDIQDDIIDQSKTKYGRKTVYGKYGREIALLVADALLFKGFTLLQKACLQIPAKNATKIIDLIKDMFYELGDAEAMELRFRKTLATPSKYLQIIKKKAAHIEAYARIGAIIGNATEIEQKNLSNYGKLLGVASIIRDEIADALDEKEARHRIKKEHLPLPLAYSLTKYMEKPYILTRFKEKKIGDVLNEVDVTAGLKLTKKHMMKIIHQANKHVKTTIKNPKLAYQFIMLINSLLIGLEPPAKNP